MLKDKVIFVTGATAGIGFQISKQALEAGAKVMMHSSVRSEAKAKIACKQLQDEFTADKVATVACDLVDISGFEAMVQKTIKQFGRIDVLVNNAGVFPRDNLLNITESAYQNIFDVNVKAPLFLSQAVVKHFIEHKIAGNIVNIGSVNAYCGQDDLLTYSASKGALMTMTRNLGDALGKHGIRVNQINVGWTHTEKEQSVQISEGRSENWSEQIHPLSSPRGKILQPDEVANHVIFWASDLSSPVSGSIYEVEQYPLIGRNKINHN